MTKKKVQLACISNQTSRRITFRNRSENLIRKLNEISTLTGSVACGIILSPFEGDPPTYWPPNINDILDSFFSLPETDRSKRMVTVESYLLDEISKLEETHKKLRGDVMEMELNYTMHSIHSHGKSIESLSFDETCKIFWFLEEVKKRCEMRMRDLDANGRAGAQELRVGDDPRDPWLARDYINIANNMQANHGNAGYNNNN
ncbi:unnamed protein product [Rhodiola kirilowii]